MRTTNWLTAAMTFLMTAQSAAWARQPLQQVEEDGLTIHIRNFSDLDEPTVAAAARDVERIFRQANLPLRVRVDHMEVRDGELKPVVLFTPRRTDLLATILSPEMAATLSVGKDVLGLAPGAELKNRQVAYVFAHRVKEISRLTVRTVRGGGPAWIASESRLLAYAVAHEIAHLLLNSPAHPARGIMRAHWRYSEILSAVAMNLRFSADEVSKMRQEATRRLTLARLERADGDLRAAGTEQPRP